MGPSFAVASICYNVESIQSPDSNQSGIDFFPCTLCVGGLDIVTGWGSESHLKESQFDSDQWLMKLELWTSAKADKEFSLFIRDRDKTCFFCPNKATQNSHFWGRGNSATRYDPENCDGICGGCHMRHEGSKQGLYRDLKIVQLGQARYDDLELRARSIVKRHDAIVLCMRFLEHGIKV
jgi:hypothetical protein